MSAPTGELKRVIGFWGGTALIVGITIGSGIFRKPATLAGEIPHPGLILALWAGFGLISIFGALTLAELSSMMPRSGGTYVYLRAAYGDAAAFVFGWIYLLVATPAAVGALATFFAELFAGVCGIGLGAVPWIAAVSLLLLSAANLAGARLGSAIQGVFTVVKVGALLLLMAVSFFVVEGSFGHLAAAPGAKIDGAALGRAAASVIWAYDGWVAVSMITGEVVAAEKTMKRIIVAGMLTIVALYLGANLGYFHAMPLAAMAAAKDGVPQSIMGRAWEGGATVVAVCIMCSVFGALNGNILAKPRVSYALAQDGLTFRFLGRAHPRWSTPWAAILIQTAAALALIFLLRDPKKPGALFDRLTTYFVVVEWFALLFAVGAVFVLRRTMPDAPRPFRTPLYPWVPLAFVVGTTAGLAAIVWGGIAQEQPDWSPVWGLGIAVVGFPVYWLWRKATSGSARGPDAPAGPPSAASRP